MLKNLLFLAILGLFVVAAFVGVNLYLGTSKSTISPNLQKVLEPIDDSFDLQVLESLKNRTVVDANLETETNIVAETNTTATAGARTTITPTPTTPETD